MHVLLTHSLSVFIGLFAIMNPIANAPVFLGLTANDDEDTRRKIAVKALTLAFVIILIFAAGGKWIFELFGITLVAFRITGGLLVALVGYQMLHGGENSSVQHPSDDDRKESLEAELEVAVTPLAMPILAGPGTIATAMNFASAGGLQDFLVTMAAFLVLCLASYALFMSGESFTQYLGHNGIKVVTRLMGLILAVVGVQMLIGGIAGAVSGFQGAAAT